MVMTANEILRDYRAAKSPMKQIGILADVNCCEKRDIVNILLEMGEKVPGNFLPGKRGKKQDAPAAEAPAETVMRLDRAQTPVPAMTKQDYSEVVFWLAYGSGACLAIEDAELRRNIADCFEKAHAKLKEVMPA